MIAIGASAVASVGILISGHMIIHDLQHTYVVDENYEKALAAQREQANTILKKHDQLFGNPAMVIAMEDALHRMDRYERVLKKFHKRSCMTRLFEDYDAHAMYQYYNHVICNTTDTALERYKAKGLNPLSPDDIHYELYKKQY